MAAAKEKLGKKEIAADLAQKSDMSQTQAEALVNSVFDIIQDKVMKGHEVAIHGFGRFMLHTRAARKGRNPATGESIKIAAKTSIKFKPHAGSIKGK